MPPLVTARVDARIALPNLSIEADTPAELTLEDGSVRPVTIRGGKAATVPAVGQPGYHRLRFADREITLAVAPARCLTLEEVGAGRRMWGVAAQIYGLRRAGDGGIGDAGAVRDLAEAAARHGADAVALSPVHGLFAADPARYGPYSPSSRLFFNPLYADPAAVFGADRVAARTPPGREALEEAPLIDWLAAGAAKFALLRGLYDDFAAAILPPERHWPPTSSASCTRAARPCASTRCSKRCMPGIRATGATGRRAGVIRATRRSRPISRARPGRCATTCSCNGSPRAPSPPPRRRRGRPACASA